MTQQEHDTFLTRQEASKFLGVTPRTIDRYADEGRITRYRRDVPFGVFFKQSELEPLMQIKPEQRDEQQ